MSDFTAFNWFLDSVVAVSKDLCPISAAAQEQDKDVIYINGSTFIQHNENIIKKQPGREEEWSYVGENALKSDFSGNNTCHSWTMRSYFNFDTLLY